MGLYDVICMWSAYPCREYTQVVAARGRSARRGARSGVRSGVALAGQYTINRYAIKPIDTVYCKLYIHGIHVARGIL